MFNLTESRFFQCLETLANIFILNLLFLITCLPIITIGAATASLYEITLKMAEGKEAYIFTGYLKAFASNFKSATTCFVILSGILVVLVVDIICVSILDISEVLGSSIKLFSYSGICYIALISSYVFALLAKFQDTWKVSLKNAFFMSIRHLPLSVLILFLHAAGIFVFTLAPHLISVLIPYYGFAGFAVSAYVTSYVFMYLFKKYYGV